MSLVDFKEVKIEVHMSTNSNEVQMDNLGK
jgi:hypothetical protein